MKTKVEFDAITLHEALIHNGMQEVAMEILCTRSNKVNKYCKCVANPIYMA